MKNYINPEMNISRFYVENIRATDVPTLTELPGGYLLSIPEYSTQVLNKIDGAQQSVHANVHFQDAIKFK